MSYHVECLKPRATGLGLGLPKVASFDLGASHELFRVSSRANAVPALRTGVAIMLGLKLLRVL